MRNQTWLHANSKGADQLAHPRSFMSAFVICSLESKITKLATLVSLFYLVSVAKQAGLNLNRSHTPKTARPNYNTVKPVLSGHSKRRPKLVFKTDYRLIQVKSVAECSNGAMKHSAILSTFIKLPFVIKSFVLSFFEWVLKTCSTVLNILS